MGETDPVTELDELQTELCILQSHLDRLLTCIRQNEASLRRFQSLETQLLSLNSLRELVEHLLDDTRTVFELDFVTFALVDSKGKLQQFLKEDGLLLNDLKELILLPSALPLKYLFGRGLRPYVGVFSARYQVLFPHAPPP